jgi:inosine-uridine nucleoside N-ribohydrolase
MPIPVILDTDIGLDVDDVWALVFLLRCPELDVKLITTATGDPVYRARLVARLLEIEGRTEIPIGIGLALDDSPRTHADWLGDYQLEDYPGRILTDGIGAIGDTIASSEEPMTVIAIGPVPNLAAALDRYPELTARSRLVGMHGSLRRGYLGAPKPMREYNVKQHSLACQRVFNSNWDITITPLDSCGTTLLKDERFAQLLAGDDPLLKAALANHFSFFTAVKDWPLFNTMDPNTQTSILYDTVAVYLAFSDAWLKMETLPILVTDDGKTLIDKDGRPVRCATAWHDESAFLDFLVERLLNGQP